MSPKISLAQAIILPIEAAHVASCFQECDKGGFVLGSRLSWQSYDSCHEKCGADNGQNEKSVIESTAVLVSRAALYLIKICLLVAMGSNDGDNGAVTLDQTDMLPRGRRVIGFACETGQGGLGQCEGTQDLGHKLGEKKNWPGSKFA